MAEVTIYGASDDLVEIEGDLNEEFYAAERDGKTGMMLAFGDGTILDITYDDFGVWRINRGIAGSAYFDKDRDPGDHESRYSDRVKLTGDLRWVVSGERVTVHRFEAAKVVCTCPRDGDMRRTGVRIEPLDPCPIHALSRPENSHPGSDENRNDPPADARRSAGGGDAT